MNRHTYLLTYLLFHIMGLYDAKLRWSINVLLAAANRNRHFPYTGRRISAAKNRRRSDWNSGGRMAGLTIEVLL